MNLAEAVAFAEADVAEVGADFVYNPGGAGLCYYVKASDPRFPWSGNGNIPTGAAECGCMVGRILDRAGLMTDGIAAARSGVRGLVSYGLIKLDSDALKFLTVIQCVQDAGGSAGDALAAGKRAVGLVDSE
jgi:hypothetical protein